MTNPKRHFQLSSVGNISTTGDRENNKQSQAYTAQLNQPILGQLTAPEVITAVFHVHTTLLLVVRILTRSACTNLRGAICQLPKSSSQTNYFLSLTSKSFSGLHNMVDSPE